MSTRATADLLEPVTDTSSDLALGVLFDGRASIVSPATWLGQLGHELRWGRRLWMAGLKGDSRHLEVPTERILDSDRVGLRRELLRSPHFCPGDTDLLSSRVDRWFSSDAESWAWAVLRLWTARPDLGLVHLDRTGVEGWSRLRGEALRVLVTILKRGGDGNSGRVAALLSRFMNGSLHMEVLDTPLLGLGLKYRVSGIHKLWHHAISLLSPIPLRQTRFITKNTAVVDPLSAGLYGWFRGIRGSLAPGTAEYGELFEPGYPAEWFDGFLVRRMFSAGLRGARGFAGGVVGIGGVLDELAVYLLTAASVGGDIRSAGHLLGVCSSVSGWFRSELDVAALGTTRLLELACCPAGVLPSEDAICGVAGADLRSVPLPAVMRMATSGQAFSGPPRLIKMLRNNPCVSNEYASVWCQLLPAVSDYEGLLGVMGGLAEAGEGVVLRLERVFDLLPSDWHRAVVLTSLGVLRPEGIEGVLMRLRNRVAGSGMLAGVWLDAALAVGSAELSRGALQVAERLKG